MLFVLTIQSLFKMNRNLLRRSAITIGISAMALPVLPLHPPPHLYAAPGLYTVKLAITGFDGCISDTSKKIIAIGDYPVAGFEVNDSCAGKPPRIIDRSTSCHRLCI